MSRIDILLFDGVEELDAVGPWEIFAAWAHLHPEDGWTVRMISPDGAPVVCAKGLVLAAHAGLDDLDGTGVLLHPGGIGTRALMRDERHLDWVRAAREAVPLLASVCSGSLVYAAAGLLRGKRATTHWGALDLLAKADPTVVVDAHARWVDEGDIVSSAGVSAGIDMALHLVSRLATPERAEEVRHYVDYAPA
ncbi:MAG: DJ-1/PfpI family protein [Segniliparus sp.]|uniref:DJ-1/PfpI family protein n=1 Tax=Segniliparus sp. TaxID=2804064 RepID=UPI003F341D83